MNEKKDPKTNSLETTMACQAYAEAGEPCPLDMPEAHPVQALEEDFACTAFSDANQACVLPDPDKR